MTPPDDQPISRRDLLKAAGAAGAALATVPRGATAEPVPPSRPPGATSMLGVPFERHETVRLAIVGTGLRGTSVLGEWLAVDGVRITALCDVVP